MAGIQTANVLLEPKVKKEIDNLLYQVALLDTTLGEVSDNQKALSLGDVCTNGYVTDTPIEANGLTSNNGVFTLKLGEYIVLLKINPANGSLLIIENGVIRV